MDLKLTGYLISSTSVLLLGSAAWPGFEAWTVSLLIAGMTASILGMVCRYLAHRREKKAIAYAQREVERAK